MSSDVYIPLEYVVSHPERFALSADIVGVTVQLASELASDSPDLDYIEYALKPELYVTITDADGFKRKRLCTVMTGDGTAELHMSIRGKFRSWIIKWLDYMKAPYEFHE